MKLLSLRARGLRSFPDGVEVDFARLGEHGLFAIVGPTGAGKSTLLDGVFLALFGRCPRGDASECVSLGATELSVRLEVTVGRGSEARDVAIERVFRWSRRREGDANGRGASRHPPLRIEERQSDVWVPVELGGRKPDAFVREELVRVSMADFQQAVVLPQGEFGALLSARPAERRILLASLFRTEHLGQALFSVLGAREQALRDEMGRLEQAEREVHVAPEELASAKAMAETLGERNETASKALLESEATAREAREARRRCALRDTARGALEEVSGQHAARTADRTRLELGQRAAKVDAPLAELERAETAFLEAEARDAALRGEARKAVEELRVALRTQAEARAARVTLLPSLLERLGKARMADERARELSEHAAARAEIFVRARDASKAIAEAREAAAALAARVETRRGEEHALAERLEKARVGEEERARVTARSAVAERCLAEERLADTLASERLAAESLVARAEASLVESEIDAQKAALSAERSRAELKRREVDRARAVVDVELAERTLEQARAIAAAADLAGRLTPGEPCPVCGAHEHPGRDHALGALSISMGERAIEAARREALAAEQALAEAARETGARDEEARSASAGSESVALALGDSRAALLRLDTDDAPRSVLDARAALSRARSREELALSALPEGARGALLRTPVALAEVEREALELAARAREAESLGARTREIRAAAEAVRVELATAEREVERRAERRARCDAELGAVEHLLRASARDVETLLAELVPKGQSDLFDRPRWPATPSAWIERCEREREAIVTGEARADAEAEALREAEAVLSVEAREAAAARLEAERSLGRAQKAALAGATKAGFEGLDDARAARVEPAQLAALAEEMDALERVLARRLAAYDERARDVEREVDEASAREAEAQRDAARAAADALRERAAEARALREELERRRARSAELRARIEELAPKADRFARIRQVTSANQLAELAAERHLEAVTRGAAALLQSMSKDRYAVVRAEDGSFAVADASHGGLVRPPSTLSGGETFLVSLALALSLSERIQLAGRTRFDFFFLDEGFGALDPVTLDEAIGALERLRSEGRVIGMISHVAAIEERMPRRLRVIPGRAKKQATVTLEPKTSAEPA